MTPISSTEPRPHRSASFAQLRLLHAYATRCAGGGFIECPDRVVSAVRITGALDVAALNAAVDAIVARHEVLRWTFVTAESGVRVDVSPFSSLDIPVVDLSALDAAARDRDVTARLDSIAERRFEPQSAPLYRFDLVRYGAEEHVFIAVFDHLVFDGSSLHLFWSELASIYEAVTQAGSGTPRLPELASSYDAFVRWQRQRVNGIKLTELIDDWRQRLSGAPELPLADLTQARTATTDAGRTVALTIDADLAQRLRDQSRRIGVTTGVLMNAVFTLLLHRLGGVNDVVFGMPIGERSRSDFEPLIGLFLNLLVLRIDVSGDPSCEELIARVRRGFLGAYAHGALPYWHLSPGDGRADGPTLAPIRAVFNFVLTGGVVPALPGLRVESLRLEGRPRSFADVSMHLFDGGHAISGFVLYNTDRVSRARAEECATSFPRLLDRVLRSPATRVSGMMRDEAPPSCTEAATIAMEADA